MEENEAKADGVRQARGFVKYPYTNRHYAQGYTKYAPLSTVFPILFQQTELSPALITVYERVNDELIRRLVARPELMRDLDPRRFEELIAELFAREGFEITLTQRTRDGGKDIYALRHDALGRSLYLIECKRYAASQKVGVETVRSLYGVTEAENATKGIIATTSSFTRAALDFALPLQYRLSLRDYEDLVSLLRKHESTHGR